MGMMDRDLLKKKLEGCYITVPTMFRDPDLEVDTAAIQRHVAFLMKRGINADNGVLLAGGAAGDFSTMSFDERALVAGPWSKRPAAACRWRWARRRRVRAS